MSDNDPLRRQDDVHMAVLTQEFRDFVKQYYVDHAMTEVWRDKFDSRLKEFELFMEMTKRPYRAALYILGGVLLAACSNFSLHLIHWLGRLAKE